MGRSAALVLCALLVVGAAERALAAENSVPSSADVRIRYYKARLGGPGTYPIYARLGAAYIQKARETGRLRYYREAERYLLRSLEFQPNYEALHWLSSVYLAQHRFPEALQTAEEAVQAMPDSNTLGNLLDAHLAIGDIEKASGLLARMSELQPGFEVSVRRANLQQYHGDLEGARESFLLACAQADAHALPVDARAWCQVRLGSLWLAGCDTERAEAAYRKGLELFPAYPLAQEHIAELRAAQGRAPEAIQIYRTLLKANPAPEFRLALADALELNGRAADAARQRTRARRDMQRSVARGERVYLRPLALLLTEDKASAPEALRLAELDWKNRQDAYAADTLAWAHFANGHLDEAQRVAEKALSIGTRNPTILLHAARIYHSLGDRERARTLLARAAACREALSPSERAAEDELGAELLQGGKR
ncbi:MAG TPA: tetratricopeptide repeat protein [Candidatus Xenobia bacterium]|nr:tetratricopeptide repeat protein [Candidatus Xenobia bacterium]